MDWQLTAYANTAGETAHALYIFSSEIPQYRKDITDINAKINAIASALYELNDDLDLKRYGRYAGRIMRDMEIVLPSLKYTLEELKEMCEKGESGKSKGKKARKGALPGAFPGTPDYMIVWEDTLADFEEEGMALKDRLEDYKLFLQDMHKVLKG